MTMQFDEYKIVVGAKVYASFIKAETFFLHTEKSAVYTKTIVAVF
jgi:hypothetical protein